MSKAKVADSNQPATDGAIVTRADGQVVALWYASGLVFKLTPKPESAIELEIWLNEMAVVSDDEWQLLVPSDWVARNDIANAVEQLMRGVPTPAGFDTGTILAAAAPGDPEQLASRTASLVACAWINQWLRAADSGSAVSVDQAVSAMQTESSWPTVEQLSQDSSARRTLIDYAAAMATESGIVGDSELTVGASYQQALGCFYTPPRLPSRESHGVGPRRQALLLRLPKRCLSRIQRKLRRGAWHRASSSGDVVRVEARCLTPISTPDTS